MKSQLVHWLVMFKQLRCRLNVKLKPVALSCAYGFRNNYVLHSVYFRSLVDLETKSCVRVPLVIILPECELNHCSHEQLSQGIWRAFLRRENIPTLHQALWQYMFRSGTLTQLLFSKSTNDLKINWVQHIILPKALSTGKYYRFELGI